MVINSLDNNKIKNVKKLKNAKYMNESKRFIVEGEHLVEEALNAGLLKEVIKLDSNQNEYSVPEILVTDNIMKSISSLPSYPSVIGICDFIKEKKELGNKIIILDDVQDPGNLGTIIRTAVAFNYDTIVLSKNSVNKYNEKVVRATQGMLFKINIIEEDITLFIPKIKKMKYKVYATNVENGTSLKNIKKEDKFAFVLGNEGNGVSKKVSDLSDENIYINTDDNCESLNVAIAGAIIMYELS